MTGVLHGARLGVARGLLDGRRAVSTPSALVENFWFPLAVAAVINGFVWLNRNQTETIGGTEVSLPIAAMAEALAFVVVWYGLVSVAYQLAAEREDGTLLRLKAVPQGLTAYLVALLIGAVLQVLIVVALIALPALVYLDGFAAALASGLPAVVGLMGLGLVTCVPLGLVMGSVFRGVKAVEGWLTQAPFFLLLGISSGAWIFPAPSWTQPIAEVFPIYWLGLGMRSVLLPDPAAAAEVAGSWRPVAMFAVLGLWTAVAVVIAPIVLRRAVRRESGSRMAAERERVLQETT